jgi:hypothetical protein
MLQVKTFLLPSQENEANQFLATHKPADQGINFNKDMLIVFFEDGRHSVAYDIAQLQSLGESVAAATFQQEIALFTMQNERDTLNATHNKGRYEELSNAMSETSKALKLQAHKKAFIEGKIAELKAQYEEAGE